MALPERLIRTPPPATVTPQERLPALVSVPLSVSDKPAGMVFALASSHAAPLSTVTVPKLVKLVPIPVSVPVPLPAASSSALPALVPPVTVPLNTRARRSPPGDRSLCRRMTPPSRRCP